MRIKYVQLFNKLMHFKLWCITVTRFSLIKYDRIIIVMSVKFDKMRYNAIKAIMCAIKQDKVQNARTKCEKTREFAKILEKRAVFAINGDKIFVSIKTHNYRHTSVFIHYIHSTVCRCTLCRFLLYGEYCTLYTVQCTLYSAYHAVYNVFVYNE